MDNQIIHGDSLTILRQMDSDSIDAIITDPPYGIGYQSKRFGRIANDKLPYIWWLYDGYRVLKDGGCMLCFSRWDVQHIFIEAMQIAGFNVRSTVIWDKVAHGMGDTKAQFAPSYETIIFAVKGKYAFPGKRPRDLYSVLKLGSGNMQHPTEKPVELLEQLIEATTRADDLIFDPFAGSGSTLLAARNKGRRYLGLEINEDYYKVARDRLEGDRYVF